MSAYCETFIVWLSICSHYLSRKRLLTEWIFKLSNWLCPHFPPFLPNGLHNYMRQRRQDLSVCFRVHLAAIISNISRIHWARSRGSHACCDHDTASQMLHRWEDVLCCIWLSLYLALSLLPMKGLHPMVCLCTSPALLLFQWWIITVSPLESGDCLQFLWLVLFFHSELCFSFFNCCHLPWIPGHCWLHYQQLFHFHDIQ